MDFDRCTGEFSNLIHITINDSMPTGGCAFSPSGRFLYVSSTNYLYQFDTYNAQSRTLALANIAMRLSEFGKKVCILDFDLEAPGVHYKFPKVDLHNRKGLVDYIYEYVQTKERPENLQEMVITLPPTIKDGEPIQLIPAGDIHDKNYWSNLSNINWTELLYKEDGILFLLDLKERIKNELNPDFLLIDSRTGITEIAGITISLLADHVTLLAVNNPENLFGCKQLLNSILRPIL